jgi:hypothetical protein
MSIVTYIFVMDGRLQAIDLSSDHPKLEQDVIWLEKNVAFTPEAVSLRSQLTIQDSRLPSYRVDPSYDWAKKTKAKRRA